MSLKPSPPRPPPRPPPLRFVSRHSDQPKRDAEKPEVALVEVHAMTQGERVPERKERPAPGIKRPKAEGNKWQL